MKLTAKTKSLHEAFQYAGSVITTSPIAPIYQNVKLEALHNDVYVTATDLEVELKIKVLDIDVQKEGMLLVPQATLNSVALTEDFGSFAKGRRILKRL